MQDKRSPSQNPIAESDKPRHSTGEKPGIPTTPGTNRTTASPEKTPGTPTRFTDAHGCEHAVDSLQVREERMRFALESREMGIWDLNLLTGEINWNACMYDLFERDPALGATQDAILAYIHPDDIRCVRRAFESRNDFTVEHRIVLKNGKIRWLATSGRLYRDPAEVPVRMIGVSNDITKQKRMEKKLRKNASRYRSFVELTEQLGWFTNAQGKVVEDLPMFRRYTGMTSEALMGDGWSHALHPDDVQPSLRVWRKAIAEKVRYETEYRIRRHDGVYRHFLARGVPVDDGDGNVLEWVGTCIDISERKYVEKILQTSRDDLEKRVQQRTRELNDRNEQLTRLTATLTMAEQRERERIAKILHDHLQQLLVAAKMSQEVMLKDLASSLKPAAERVLDLITKSIHESRTLTTELVPPVLRSGDLVSALQWLVRWVRNNHRLNVNLTVETDTSIDVEELNVLLFESIRELLLNIIKHANVDSAALCVKEVNGFLCVAVSDQGTGFDPHNALNNPHTGNSLGLINIRERLMYVGGRMEIQSSPDEGSTVVLLLHKDGTIVDRTTFPDLAKGTCEIAEAAPLVEGEARQIRVLLVDDHEIVRQGLKTILSVQADITIVAEAANGEDAVRLARKIEPDVILMDINLPNMNGLQATQIIHAELPDIRIIALSVYLEDEVGDAALKAGASAYRSKSEHTDHLLASIRGITP